MPDYDVLDTNATVMVTLQTPYKAADGRSFYRIWGVAERVTHGDATFVLIGGLGEEMLISTHEIRFLEVVPNEPTDTTILILRSVYNELVDDMLSRKSN